MAEGLLDERAEGQGIRRFRALRLEEIFRKVHEDIVYIPKTFPPG
jgi:hypothetical protein